MLDTATLSGYVAAIVLGVAAGFERFRSIKQGDKAEVALERAGEAEKNHAASAEVLASKEELLKVARETAKEWESRFNEKDREHKEWRTESHARIDAANDKILSQSRDIAALQAKTDMTPILRFHENQEAFNLKVVESLDLVLQKLQNLK